jgi:hypothetical protein
MIRSAVWFVKDVKASHPDEEQHPTGDGESDEDAIGGLSLDLIFMMMLAH